MVGTQQRGCGAPDTQDGAGALYSCRRTSRRGRFCPVAPHTGSKRCPVRALPCVEGGRSQEVPRPGLARQQKELVPAELVITPLSSSGCPTSQALPGSEPVLGTPTLVYSQRSEASVQAKPDHVSLALTCQWLPSQSQSQRPVLSTPLPGPFPARTLLQSHGPLDFA